MKGWQALPDGEFSWRPFDCHSRCAGMACVNHWIPAFAGMTAGAEVRNSANMAKGFSGWRPAFSLFVVIPAKAGIHAYRDVRLQDVGDRTASGTSGRGREAGGVKGWQALPNGEFSWRPFDCHSRCAGMACLNHSIPALAGRLRASCPLMTTRVDFGFCQAATSSSAACSRLACDRKAKLCDGLA